MIRFVLARVCIFCHCQYAYLSNGSVIIEEEDDKEQLNEVITSLKSLGFSQGDVDQIFLVGLQALAPFIYY